MIYGHALTARQQHIRAQQLRLAYPKGQGAVDVLTDLEHWYDCDANDPIMSDQAGSWSLTNENLVALSSGIGPNGQDSINFNGSNKRYISASQAPIDLDAFSIAAWFRCTAFSSTANIIANHRGTGATNLHFQLQTTSTEITFRFWDTAAPFVATHTATISTNTWYFITATHDAASDELTIYVDGALSDTTDTSLRGAYNTTNQPFALGEGAWALSDTRRHRGQVQNVGIWSKVLDLAQHQHLYNSGVGRSYSEL